MNAGGYVSPCQQFLNFSYRWAETKGTIRIWEAVISVALAILELKGAWLAISVEEILLVCLPSPWVAEKPSTMFRGRWVAMMELLLSLVSLKQVEGELVKIKYLK